MFLAIFLAAILLLSESAWLNEPDCVADQACGQFFFNHAVGLSFYDSWRVYQACEKHSDEDGMRHAAEELSRRIFSWFVHVRKGHIDMNDLIDSRVPVYVAAIDPDHRDAFGDPYNWGEGYSPDPKGGISFNLIGGGRIDSPEEYVALLNELSDRYELEVQIVTVEKINAAKEKQIKTIEHAIKETLHDKNREVAPENGAKGEMKH